MTAKKKRSKRQNNPEIDGLMRQIRQSGLFEESEIAFQPSEGTKLSAVLLNFIEPYE